MLPGLRILFAITLLSVSVVIFGLGAAAFLRSAHEDVANAPWRPIETPVTARVDLAPTTLSMLRVEPEPTIAAITARADAEAAAAASPAETKPPVATDAAPPPTLEPRAEAPITAKPAEAAAVQPEPPPPAPQTIVAAVEPAREQAPTVAEAKAAEPRAAEVKAEDAKAPTADAQPAPTVVAALNTDKVEQTPAKSAFEPVSAPQESLDVPVSTVLPAETNAGADTLKADDKAIQPAKVAALGEPATAAPPLASKDVKLPAPRVDPAVIEARRKHQQMLVQRARAARAAAAARARRVAAARARAARAAAAAAATNPFGAPANSTTNNIRTN